MRRSQALAQTPRRVDWSGVWLWLLCFALVAYLGLEGGGYDPLTHDQVGIAVWWVLLAAVAVGALPRRSPGTVGWLALALLAAFVGWTALSLVWTESLDRTFADLARLAGYLGIFALAVFSQGARGARLVVSAVGAAIALVAIAGLLSRLQPDWLPAARDAARALGESERLSYPLNYWNALAALVAIGLPLLLWAATCARTVALRALAAAALPALALTAFLTLSRGGIAAALLAPTLFLVLTPDRLPKLLSALLAGGGSAALIAAAVARDALGEGLPGPVAAEQGDEVLTLTIAICAAVGLLQAAIALAGARWTRPRWTLASPRLTGALAAIALLAGLAGAAALDAPSRASSGWEEFKQPVGPAEGGPARLASLAGQSRFQLWEAALDQNSARPLTGTGAGSFEFWWTRAGEVPGTVRDTHSLYMQTLGEVGIVGLALLVAFLLTVLVGGARAILGAGSPGRPQLAAALAGFVAFCLTAAFDWMWQIPVLPVATLLLAAALIAARRPGGARRPSGFTPPLRAAVAVVALAAIAAIAIPLATTSLLRQSEADARSGDLEAALRQARTAENVQPGAAAPRLQQALVLEAQGSLGAAAAAARAATEREATNWRNWLVLSRIEARRGQVDAAIRAYRRARSLNPHFSLFGG